MRLALLLGVFALLLGPSSSLVSGRGGALSRAARSGTRSSPRGRVLTMGLDAWLEDLSMQGDTSFDVGTLMFDVNELMLPGQSRYLHLYEERFVQLFQDALENSAVFAMGFFSSEQEVLGVVTLVEIEEFQPLQIGVGVTIRAVTRGYVECIAGVEPYVKMTCSLFEDDLSDMLGSNDAEERLFAVDEQLRDLEETGTISSALSEEFEVDPRAFISADGKRLGDEPLGLDLEAQGIEIDEADDANNEMLFEQQPLRWRVREASAARMDSLGDDIGTALAARRRQVCLSFLGLENCSIEQKLAAYLTQDTLSRLEMGIAATEDRINMLNMKRLLESTLQDSEVSATPEPAPAPEPEPGADEVLLEPEEPEGEETEKARE